MTDKSDDIKQLFSHLGLDHNVYQEMRTAPRPSVTITETPRRWSLLQSVAQPPAVTPIAPAPAPVAPPPAFVPVTPLVPVALPTAAAFEAPVTAPRTPPLPPVAPVASSAPTAAPLPRATGGLHRGEPPTPLWPSSPAPMTATPAPGAATASPAGRMSADESLRLLFQAVREPGPASGTASADGFEADAAPARPRTIPSPADASDAPATLAMPRPGDAAALPPVHGHNRPTRNPQLQARPAMPPVVEAAPLVPPAPPTAVTPPPAAPAASPAGGGLGALFDRLRGQPEAAAPAPGRLRLNVPKRP